MFDDTRTSELASRAKEGDVAAFDALLRGCDRGIVELAARLLPDRADAEDVRQLAWLRVWQGLREFDERSRFTTWAFRIVVNLCRDRERERARRERRLVVGLEGADAPASEPGPDAALERDETAALVRAALDALPADERECLVLRHYHDVPASEIAAIVGRPRTTVQSCLARALTRLQFRLRPLLAQERAIEPKRETS